MLDDEGIVRCAVELLPEPEERKRWSTARSLARRMRERYPARFGDLGQDRLFEVLLRHYDCTEAGERLVRPSRLPSSKTLETLWGRVRLGEAEQAESPILRGASGDSVQALLDPGADDQLDEPSDDESRPDFFLSYNQHDETEALRIGGILDNLGWSTWVAGERISPGGNINQHVRDAIEGARGFGLYLTENSVRSLWVGKELLYGMTQLTQHLILNANDTELIRIVAALRAGTGDAALEEAWRQRINNLKSLEVHFDEHLRHLAQQPDRVFIHHPEQPTPEATLEGLPPLSEFPRNDADA